MQRLKVPRYIQWIAITAIIFLLVMTIFRLAITWIFPVPSHSFADLLPSLYLGIRYDLRIVSIISLVLFLVGSIRFLHPLNKKRGMAIAFVLWTVFILLLIIFYTIDYTNYAYLSQRMNANLLNYLQDTSISLKMIWQSYPVLWMVLAILITTSILLWIVRTTYNYILSKPIVATRASRITWSIFFFLLLAFAIFGRVGQYPLRWSDAFSLRSDYAANLALNPFQSFFSSLKFRHSSFDLQKVKDSYLWMSEYLGVENPDTVQLHFTRKVPAVPSETAPRNVVLVICESFSSYKSSLHGNPLNTTPFFSTLVSQGAFFERCFAPHYGTARGIWATITGVPDVSLTKTASRNPAAVDQHSIITDFKEHEKIYFIGGSTSWANIRGLLVNNIPDLQLFEEDDFDAGVIDVWGISDKNLFLEANKLLSKKDKPFFAVIQTAGNHRPYTIPKEDLDEFKVKKVPQDSLIHFGFASVEEYNAFRYTDYTFQKFMEAAAKEPYFQNTLFVFIGDHGIRGDAKNMFPSTWTEQGLTTVHVPLLFYYPKGLPASTSKTPASQVDVLPTIAGIAGISYTNTSLGFDLLSGKKPKYAFVFDPDIRQIGVLDDSVYYNFKLGSNQESISSMTNNETLKPGQEKLRKYKAVTSAFYETSRYLLLNNKKLKD